MKANSLLPCPGCGGRNPSDAPACDWCGRPFVTAAQPVSPRWVRLASSLAFAGLVVLVVVLAILNASRSPGQPEPTVTPTTRSAAGGAPPLVVIPTPLATQTPTAEATPSPTPELLTRARIANTGGLGVFLRREPSAAAPSVTALREGAEVRVLTQEEVTAARVWRLVRDARDLEGWVLADYLEFIGE